jgi:hypothetical protein
VVFVTLCTLVGVIEPDGREVLESGYSKPLKVVAHFCNGEFIENGVDRCCQLGKRVEEPVAKGLLWLSPALLE